MELGRRSFAGVLGAAGVSALAGCSSFTGDGGPQSVTATEPNDDGEATPGELRYLIENVQDGLDGDTAIQLTRMVRGEGDGYTYINAAYESSATNIDEFVDEVGVFAQSYRIYVREGTDVATDFTIDVQSRYDGQPESFGIKREWARRVVNGERNANWYINTIASTFAYPTTTSESNTSLRGDKI